MYSFLITPQKKFNNFISFIFGFASCIFSAPLYLYNITGWYCIYFPLADKRVTTCMLASYTFGFRLWTNYLESLTSFISTHCDHSNLLFFFFCHATASSNPLLSRENNRTYLSQESRSYSSYTYSAYLSSICL